MLGRSAVLVAVLASTVSTVHADSAGVCHVVDVKFQPEKRTDLRPARQMSPQIVVWVEDAQGNYIDTIFITQATGTYGLGNRPGRADFNSAPGWPYGRRITTFPVWATKKPQRYDSIVFQDKSESNLSHAFNQSSLERHFCRPMDPDSGQDQPHYDALTCASPSTVFTDKGERDDSMQSLYPPRQDVARAPGRDDTDVDTYRDMNTFDAVSQATPPIGQVATVGWPLPFERENGEYVMFVEASTEYDHNTTYSEAARPGPPVTFGEYGEPFRGQPSVVWRVPFTIGDEPQLVNATQISGYGSPDGEDGDIRAADGTITRDVLGSGEQRLALVTDADGSFRVRVQSRLELDYVVPNKPGNMQITAMDGRTAIISFLAPGDDALAGTVRNYEIRYRIGDKPFTAENFDDPDTIVIPQAFVPVAGNEQQDFEMVGLLPQTDYTVGVRAIDDCKNISEVASLAFSTPDRQTGEVDACFIATAAYGSPLAADVANLRGFRDHVLRKMVLGELFVETYYTFSPPLAGVVGESELLRATARAALAPITSLARRSDRP